MLGGWIAVSRYTQAALEQMYQIFTRGTVAGLTEGKLLERFALGHDEAALAVLVARHGPMVLGVCRRILRDEHEVEDAFQATFLVLVRRAGAIRDGDRVGPWLYGVAYRVAVRARANAARRHAREPAASATVETAATTSPSVESARFELRAVLDEELARLPDSLQAPLVLCYLEGLTHEEAAQRLHWPVGTLRSRMARARDRLRRRLARRGLAGDDAALSLGLAARPISPALIDVTVRASLGHLASGPATVAPSATAAALANGVLNAMLLTKLKILGAAALACVAVLGTVQTYAYQFGGLGAAPKAEQSAPENGKNRAELIQAVDRIQAELTESIRRNVELQKQVQALRAELEALRSNKPPDVEKEEHPDDHVAAKVETGKAKGREGKLNDSPPPTYVEINGLHRALMVISPEGDRVVVYYPGAKVIKTLRLSEDRRTQREVVPIVGPGLAALMVTGPKITKLGVFDTESETWYPVDLREPVDQASPIVAPGSVVYTLGRRIYAFTSAAKHWDVLEFPEGANPTPTVGLGSITYKNDGHIYTFDNATGKWDDLDLRAILDAPEDKDDAKTRPDHP